MTQFARRVSMISRRCFVPFALTALILAPQPGAAKDKDGKTAASSIAPLLSCRSLTESAARLSCYDQQVDSLQQATTNTELVVMNNDDIKKTKRSLFGFTIPRLSIFGKSGDEKDRDGESEITAKAVSLRSMGYGKWAFTLDDGARWETTEAVRGAAPKANDEVVIKQGALGSYMAQFDKGRAVRVKRIN